MRVARFGAGLFRGGLRFSLVVAAAFASLGPLAGPAACQPASASLSSGSGAKVSLTPGERAWLDAHPDIVLGYGEGYEPDVIVDLDGSYRGFLVDVLSQLNHRLGASLRLEVGPVAELFEKIRRKEIDGALAIHPENARRRGLISTREFFHVYPAAFTRSGLGIHAPADLAGRRVAIVEEVFFAERLTAKYGRGGSLLRVRNALEGLNRVTQGEVDVFLGKSTNTFLVTKYQLLGLTQPFVFEDERVAGVMAVRSDWPVLATVLDKGLASFGPGEIEATVAKWVQAPLPESLLPSVRYEQGLPWRQVVPWAGSGVAAAALVITVVLVWNRRLQREVRQRRIAEARLARAKETAERANRTKSLFLANMSHELRTPLNAILGFSSMLNRDPSATASQKQKLAVIRRSGQHLLAMIDDILDLSKIEAGRIDLDETSFDLVALLEDVAAGVHSRAAEKGLTFSLRTEAVGHRYLCADAGKVRHILGNLMGNAVKFTSVGEVTLRCTTRGLAAPSRCEVVLEVEDTGPGIDLSMRHSVFEPFVRERAGARSPDGVGLGLSICKSLTDVIGGVIELESEPGRGSLFRVRFPAAVAAPGEVRTDAEAARRVIGVARGERPWRILVVDDDPDHRAILKTLLDQAGFLVLEAANGEEGVEAFRKHAPDLVWLDMRMPVMDGYSAVRRMRELPRGNHTPVVAMTASAFREEAADILAAGCDDVVVKPANEQAIFEAMQRFLPLEYRYEGDGTAVARPSHEELSIALVALPAAVRQSLRAAAASLRQKELEAALEAVRALDPGLAASLGSLEAEVRFDRILELLRVAAVK